MTLDAGRQLLHYRLIEKIGEGGMGVVWKAVDTTLDREVAIKVLPEVFTAEEERLARFEREAKLLASLNHPGIASVYGLHQADGVRFIAMELVEGEDLQRRLARGPFPLDEALATARRIAEALEAAHEHGVIHRDLKPANVTLAADGSVKVLDFGLAKALEAGSSAGNDPSFSPTITSAATRAGVIMGTAAYMSPEQARGSNVDKRADIWSFGCLLLELLTGRNPFVEDTISDTLASVLRSDPNWKGLPEDASPGLRRLLRRCLEKDPARRLRDIGEARIAIDEILDGTAESGVPVAVEPAKPTRTIAFVVGAVLVTAVVTAWIVRSLAPATPPAAPRRFEPIQGPFSYAREAAPVLSPDGRKIVFSRDGSLWIRRLDQLEPRRLDETAGAVRPAWSPDSEFIAFNDRDDLRAVSVSRGEVETIAIGVRDLGQAGGIAWGPDGQVAFSTGNAGILLVSARGGEPKELLLPDNDKEDDFHELTYLPDGSILYVVHRSAVGADTVAVLSGGEARYLFTLDGGRVESPVYSPTGHIVYRRTQSKTGLWAVPFALERLELAGEPFLVAPDGSSPSVADDGTLLYVSGSSDELRQLVWVDRDGTIDETPVGSPLLGIAKPALSPDGTRVAVMGTEDDKGNIWVYDLERNTRSRLTFGGQIDWDPTWSPDGRHIVFWHGDTRAISRKSADGTGDVERILTEDFRDSGLPSISADGKWMAFWMLPTGELGVGDVWYKDLEEGGDPVPIVQTPFNEDYLMISPGGDFLVYGSDESGRPEVYLTRFPSGDGRWQVSVNGGALPRWSPAGEEIFYAEGSRIKAVRVSTDPSLRLGAPETLFDLEGTGVAVTDARNYDVARDGRFLMVQDIRNEEDRPSLVLNYDWIERP